MESQEAGNVLLKEKYNLHKAPEVEDAAKRTEHKTGTQVSQNPLDRIQNYLNRFHEIADRENPKTRERGMIATKRLLYRKNVVKPDEIPESYWESQRLIIRERGQEADLGRANWDEEKRQSTEVIIADQKSSLDTWIDYLSSSDAPYPDSFKYFALRSVLELGKYDKEKKEFSKRFTGMTQPFPELDREALSFVADGLVKKYGLEYFSLSENIDTAQSQLEALTAYEKKKAILDSIPAGSVEKTIDVEVEGKTIHIKPENIEKMRASLQQPTNLDREELEENFTSLSNKRTELLQNHNLPEEFFDLPEDENFAKLYAYAIEKVTPVLEENLANTQGEWVKYNQGSDHIPLVASLQGHGTGWCTSGETTAQVQLSGGDFYVYYSNDSQGKPRIPRVAIRMEGARIAEVRGIASEQNLDSYIAPVVESKLEEFPDGKAYEKKVIDMQHLTAIDHKIHASTPLDHSDLAFLYEIDGPIQGFGFSRDPRIKECLSQRDSEEDMPVIFDCDSLQIARDPSQIRRDTKAYVGELTTGVFDKLVENNVEHIYTSFPERRILRQVTVGGKIKKQLLDELKQSHVFIIPEAREMLESPDFITSPTMQRLDIVSLRAQELGLSANATIDEAYARAKELGLDLCPAEVVSQYALQYKDQPIKGNFLYFDERRNADSYAGFRGFSLEKERIGSPMVLDGGLFSGNRSCGSRDEFIFGLLKGNQQYNISDVSITTPLSREVDSKYASAAC